MSTLCECGCGETPNPGKRFLLGHYSRTLRRARPSTARTGRCPRCDRLVVLRADGTPGVHWATGDRAETRYRCPAGGVPRPDRTHRKGRRVTVSVDVLLPAGWDVPRFRAEAAAALRAYLDEPFVIAVDVEDAEEAS